MKDVIHDLMGHIEEKQLEEKQFIIIEFHFPATEQLDTTEKFLVQRCADLAEQRVMQKLVREIRGRETATCQGEVFRVIEDSEQELRVELRSGDQLAVMKESKYIEVYLGGPEYEVPE
jgi:hypothetical protein